MTDCMQNKRQAIGPKLRFEIFKRDGFQCQYCGAVPPAATLHVDHITPVAEGGDNDDTNLITACDVCNFGKGARTLDQVPPTLGDRAAVIAERELQLRGYGEVVAARQNRIEHESWLVADVFCEQFNTQGNIRKAWFVSIQRFVEKLGVHACIKAMEMAVSRKATREEPCFKYFCGICWNLIREGGAL